MVVALAPWSVVLEPGNPQVIVPQGDLQIKNAALPDVLVDESGRTTVKLTYQSLASMDSDDEDEEADEKSESGAAMTTVLCSLTAGKIEQASCEIILEQDGEYILELVGKNSVHLYGNYIDQAPVDQPPFGSEMDDESEDEEDAYNLGEVSSDVEVEVDADEEDLENDDAERFEEVEDEKMEEKLPEKASPKNLKRARDDVMETDEHAKLSKSQKKKLAKKLKAADGQAVPPPTEVKKPESQTKEDKPVVDAKESKKEKKKEKKDKVEKNDDDGEKKEKGQEKKKEAVRTLEGGVKVRDVKVGTGKMVKKGDKVKMRYIGKLVNGNVFDKNTSGKPFAFTLGAGEVIKGWDVGIAGMQVEGEREVTCPPPMAYGNKRIPGIPPNSTLIFEVKLLEIK